MRFFVHYVANHQRRFVQPTRHAQRRKVGNEVEIAVAQFPIGKTIARHGVHFHVGSEQIVTAVRPRLIYAFHKKFGIKTLAHQPSVVVAETHNNGFDGFLLHVLLQLR